MTASQRPGPPSEEVELTTSADETLHHADRGHAGAQLFLSRTWVCFAPRGAVFSLTSRGWSGGDGIQCWSSSRSGMAKNMLADILAENTTRSGWLAWALLTKLIYNYAFRKMILCDVG